MYNYRKKSSYSGGRAQLKSELIITIVGSVAFVSTIIMTVLLVKCNYHRKILMKLGLVEQSCPINWAAFSWNSCMEKLEYRADVVFFGDSIIRGGNFHKRFQHLKIVNLGSSGDSLAAMIRRIDGARVLSPKKVFLLGGINGLTDMNIKKTAAKYEELLNKLQEKIPAAQIYVHSVLPISRKKQLQICKNSTIIKFNEMIKEIASRKGLEYVELHSSYFKNGELNPAMTKDGIHLLPEAYESWYERIEGHLK